MPVSLLVEKKRDSFISSCLDHSYLKDVCVGKQRKANHTHTHTHTHSPTSPPALSLIYKPTHISTHTHTHTETWKCQCRSQGSEAGQPERNVVYLRNTDLASGPKINLTRTIIAAKLHTTTSLYYLLKALELTCKAAYLSQTR